MGRRHYMTIGPHVVLTIRMRRAGHVSGPHGPDGHFRAHIEHPDGTTERHVETSRRAAANRVHDAADRWYQRRAAERWASEGPL